MANQYMAQFPKMSERRFWQRGQLNFVYSRSARRFLLAKELGERFKEEDLLALGIIKS